MCPMFLFLVHVYHLASDAMHEESTIIIIKHSSGSMLLMPINSYSACLPFLTTGIVILFIKYTYAHCNMRIVICALELHTVEGQLFVLVLVHVMIQ